jgi:hypothetical protein
MEGGAGRQGRLQRRLGSFNLSERIAKTSDDEYTLAIELSAEKPVSSREIALAINLPVDKFGGRPFYIDGAETKFPVEFKGRAIAAKPFSSFSTQCQDFKLTISTEKRDLLVQDDRAYNGSCYAARIAFAPGSGEIVDAKLELTIKAKPYTTKPLDIAKAFNFGFKDQTAGDGKGGWTDQGPETTCAP